MIHILDVIQVVGGKSNKKLSELTLQPQWPSHCGKLMKVPSGWMAHSILIQQPIGDLSSQRCNHYHSWGHKRLQRNQTVMMTLHSTLPTLSSSVYHCSHHTHHCHHAPHASWKCVQRQAKLATVPSIPCHRHWLIGKGTFRTGDCAVRCSAEELADVWSTAGRNHWNATQQDHIDVDSLRNSASCWSSTMTDKSAPVCTGRSKLYLNTTEFNMLN